jgi:hypothetical protein
MDLHGQADDAIGQGFGVSEHVFDPAVPADDERKMSSSG